MVKHPGAPYDIEIRQSGARIVVHYISDNKLQRRRSQFCQPLADLLFFIRQVYENHLLRCETKQTRRIDAVLGTYFKNARRPLLCKSCRQVTKQELPIVWSATGQPVTNP